MSVPLLLPQPVGHAVHDAIKVATSKDLQRATRQAKSNLQESETAPIDQVADNELIENLRAMKEDEEDLLAAVAENSETDQTAQGELFAELGRL